MYLKKIKVNSPFSLMYKNLPFCFETDDKINKIIKTIPDEYFTVIDENEFLAFKTLENLLQKNIEDKVLLASTDYQAIKYLEGLLTDEEYKEARASRAQWRLNINNREQEIKEILVQYPSFSALLE